MKNFLFTLMVCCLIPIKLQAQTSVETIQITENIYALVGPLEQRSETNLGNNATFGFIVTDAGVALVDSGGTLLGAKQIRKAVSKVTSQPIKWVINTGGQDHRWFGNQYFETLGAQTITSLATYKDQVARQGTQIDRMSGFVGSKTWAGTEPQPAKHQFGESKTLTLGDLTLELIELGPAHTGGETAVWLPQHKVLFSGDVIYVERMLGVGSQSQHLAWINAFERLEALKPEHIVPGHGSPTDLKNAKKDTLSYLKFLRNKVGTHLDEGGEMQDINQIDQSAFSYLKVYKQIHLRNAQRVFEEMEWE